MSDKVMKVLADETGGKSYKAHKYGLDHVERPSIDYGENNIIWRKAGETCFKCLFSKGQACSIQFRGVRKPISQQLSQIEHNVCRLTEIYIF